MALSKQWEISDYELNYVELSKKEIKSKQRLDMKLMISKQSK